MTKITPAEALADMLDIFVSVEIRPVCLRKGLDGNLHCRTVETGGAKTPDFWTVYGRDDEGEAYAAADCVHQHDAALVAELFRRAGIKVSD